MFLELKQIPPQGERIERRCDAAAIRATDDGFSVVSPIDLRIDVSPRGETYHLRGRVEATLEVACSRCLDPFEQPVAADFDLRYMPAPDDRLEGEREIDQDDLSIAYYRDEAIDLGLLVREQFHLALPMKPLCRESCAGLCPSCGVNRNIASCQCETEWRDPRLVGLAALLKNRGNE